MTRSRTLTLALIVAVATTVASCGSNDARKLQLSYADNNSRDAKGELASDAPLIYGPQARYEWGGDEKPQPGDSVQAWKFTAPRNPVSSLETIASVLFGHRTRVLPQAGSVGGYSVSSGGLQFSSYGDDHSRWWSLSGPVSSAPGASSEPCAPDKSDPANTKCEGRTTGTVPPAENLLTELQAVRKATDLLTAINAADDMTAVTYTSSRDDWHTNVYASFTWMGQPTSMGWYFAYGANGVLESAGGPVFSVEKAGEYAMITVDEAIERLNKGVGWSYPVSSWGGAVTKDIAVAPDGSVSSDDTTTESVPPETATTVPPVVRVTRAEKSLVQWWVGSGVQMLLPAWTFTRDSGGEVQVVAVPDKYVEFQVPELATVDTAVDKGSSGSGGSGATENTGAPAIEEPIVLSDVESLVGLKEDEARKVASGNGWSWRITMRDGESFPVTADYQPRRVDVEITKGVVTAVTVG